MTEQRAAKMEAIASKVRSLTQSPLYELRQEKGYKPVIGEGNLEASIMLIGEAPGAQEAKTGRPFVGASGRVLDELLESIGLARKDVYITNIVKDRPPENRDPSTEEIALYAPFLEEQIALIQPKVIATLGRFAMDFVLDLFHAPQAGGKISDLHGKLIEVQAPYGKVLLLPLFHPAVTLYRRDQREILEKDVQTLQPFIKEV